MIFGERSSEWCEGVHSLGVCGGARPFKWGSCSHSKKQIGKVVPPCVAKEDIMRYIQTRVFQHIT